MSFGAILIAMVIVNAYESWSKVYGTKTGTPISESVQSRESLAVG
jgi:hypothetical protein